MDKKFAPNWHCIMGGSLGFEVRSLCLAPFACRCFYDTFATKTLQYETLVPTLFQVVCEKHSLLYMYYGGNVAVLLFKY
jgi:hypothetical protein